MNVKQLIHDIIPYYAYIILGIIVCIVIYKLYKNDNQGQYNDIETFESVLNKLKTKKGKGKNNNNNSNSDSDTSNDDEKKNI